MLSNLLAPLRAKLNLALMSAICYAVAGIAGAIALAFGIAALFTWLDDQYGTIAACLIVAAVFVVFAVIPIIVLAMARKAEERRVLLAAAKARQTQWVNPATLSLGLQAARMLGRNRGIAAAAVGSVLVGWLISQMMPGDEATEEEEAAEPAE
jgi:MFS family permease